MKDLKIMALFKNGDRDKAFKALYKLFPRIEKLIVSKGGSKSDAHDVFQEALIILYRNLQKSDFELTSSFYTYLYSVSYYVWKDQNNQFSKYELYNFNQQEAAVFDAVLEEQKYRVAENAFRELGERCQQLLQRFYLHQMSFKSIAEVMQFKSEKIAKNQKYKCLKKAKDIFQSQIELSQIN